jgi:hypothetical protein
MPCENGVYNKVSSIDDGMFNSGHVHATRLDGVSDVVYNTNLTIKQLMEQKRLFVCDVIVQPTSRISRDDDRSKEARRFSGHGGKRKKSRKPKRRNSRSNRTLNKSKK